ncbi:MAG: hypothetical protein M1818_002769 [Claussenomyces sp. TS43310]|nr:MAG: hypothetical protein M1818_002769 [Claussenomyces sp. TS43310]
MGEYSPDLEFDGLTPLRFGKEMREKAFLFQPGWRNMNHGSYGAHPAFLRHAQRRFQEDADRYPDEWINRIYPELSQQSRAAAADLLHAPLNNVVLVSNATTGTNTVLRNLVFEEGDKIIYFSTTYQALINTIDYITETTPAGKDLVEFTYPISDDALLELFRQKIAEVRRKGGKPKVVLFDTIVSIPGVRMPFEKMTQICKEEGILSCVDGAHGIGAIRLDLNALDPDFFVSNCHK